MRAILLSLFICLTAFSSLSAQIEGFWKSLQKNTGKTRCILAIYPYKNIYYGRIIATCNAKGEVDDSIYDPKGRAPGVVGNPYYSGLDIIWDLKKYGGKYKGKILDPEKGNIYKAAIWNQKENLVVRGELLFFGRNEIWYPVSDKDLPSSFVKPDLSKMVPSIPKIK